MTEYQYPLFVFKGNKLIYSDLFSDIDELIYFTSQLPEEARFVYEKIDRLIAVPVYNRMVREYKNFIQEEKPEHPKVAVLKSCSAKKVGMGFAMHCRNMHIDTFVSAELILKSRLDSLGIDYEYQKLFFSDGRFCIVDFVIGSVGIEIDDYNHRYRITEDDERVNWLISNFDLSKIIRFTDEEVLGDLDGVIEDLKGEVYANSISI
jgi:very-short-patch-repair endonuclease